MRIALTGASGLVGYPVARYLIGRGHRVTSFGRSAVLPGVPHVAWDLGGDAPDLSGQDGLVHAAFAHLPGQYRGGEGDDPAGFAERNLAGTLRLWVV